MNKENKIKFGILNPDGVLAIVGMVKQSDIIKCPHIILVSEHYREDGSCKCDDPEEQRMLIKKCGYKKSDFNR